VAAPSGDEPGGTTAVSGGTTAVIPDEILALRSSIDNIDAALVYLLAERFRLTERVGHIKATDGLPPADPAREAAQAERTTEIALGAGLDPEFAAALREFIITEVKRRHATIAAEFAAAGTSAPRLDIVA
jgi:chorismate mutase